MSRTRVKFCGMTSPADARAAADAGADAVGMILHADAKRLIDRATAKAVVAALPPYVSAVGVFVNAEPDDIVEAVNGILLQAAQLHGDETPDDVARCGTVPVIKVLTADERLIDTLGLWRKAVAAGDVPNLVGLLIDSPAGGGTGVANDFGLVGRLIADGVFAGLPSVILAGGLTPDTVGPVVRDLRPYAVDVSSGIEATFGQKSVEKMQAFIRTVESNAERLVPSPGTPGEG